MYSTPIPKLDRLLSKNKIGLTRKDYEGGLSSLCGGCGHDSITRAIVDACYELALVPHELAKFSGIGCSSKTPGYFLAGAHGFNAVHGRMPPIATGALTANHHIKGIAVSGDGDSGSIGLSHLLHAIRRGLNLVYIVENNGVYGLTKGQFSATASQDAKTKRGEANPFRPFDLAELAVQAGASFVARSFSGDKKQLVPLLKAALSHRGFCFLDVLSPCVSFNSHAESDKSYAAIRQQDSTPVGVDFVPREQELSIDYASGADCQVTLHDGSRLCLSKVGDDYDPHDEEAALSKLRSQDSLQTGLIYLQKDVTTLSDVLRLPKTALRDLDYEELSPALADLEKINQELSQ